ncbi:MAG: DUF3943 domain-containing protein [Clostridium sp.]|nr:DUF3943 domain-containing protein [Clostridium sp.]
MYGIRKAILSIFMLSMAICLKGQMPIRVFSFKGVAPDSADVARAEKRHFFRAAGEVVGFNTGLWAFDRYVQKGDWSYISFNTIKENFKHGFIWDNDNLGTNMFLHPYNGNLYYNAARSNGFNYWQSGMFAIAGSAMWELFMECEYPSTNDVIATPIGGMCIGEVCYRASDALIDDRTTGLSRAGREIGVFLISPMRGLTRVLTGDAWKHRLTPGRQFGLPDIALELSVGANVLDFQHDDAKTRMGGVVNLNIEYGDRFELESAKPYDYFTIAASLGMMPGQPLLRHFEIRGRLLAREFLEERDQHLSVGLFQHFDFYDSDSIKGGAVPYKLGIPASFGAGVYFRDVERRKLVLDAYAHANAVLLGGVASDHYRLDERNYNLAAGFSLKFGMNLVFDQDKWSVSAKHEYYRLFTWKGYAPDVNLEKTNFRTLNAMGDDSVASFGVTTLRGDFRVAKNTYITLNLEHYYRSTHYRYFPHVKSTTLAAQLMLTLKM